MEHLPDVVDTILVVAAVVGIFLTYYEVRHMVRTQRASFLKDLYSQMLSEATLREAVYKVDSEEFNFDRESFEGTREEVLADRILCFLDLVADLRLKEQLLDSELHAFDYVMKRTWDNVNIQRYLAWLTVEFESQGVERPPFERFRILAERRYGPRPIAVDASQKG